MEAICIRIILVTLCVLLIAAVIMLIFFAFDQILQFISSIKFNLKELKKE